MGAESAPTGLNVSLEDIEGVSGIANAEVKLPIQMDALPDGEYSGIEMSMNIPEEFRVADVAFQDKNVSGNTSYSYLNGRLVLSVTGDKVDYDNTEGQEFATVTLRLADYLTEDKTVTVRTDYVKVAGRKCKLQCRPGSVQYLYDKAENECIGKNPRLLKSSY